MPREPDELLCSPSAAPRTSSYLSLAKKLFVPPILHTLIFNRAPEDVLAWGERLASWGPAYILPAHLVSSRSRTLPLLFSHSQYLHYPHEALVVSRFTSNHRHPR